MSNPVRPSNLGDWAMCPRRQWNRETNRGGRQPQSIAQWVGSAAHAKLADTPEPELKGYIRYDRITPNIGTAQRQVEEIAFAVRDAMEIHGLRPIEWEIEIGKGLLPGTIDVLMATDEFAPVFLGDVKTGQSKGSGVWLQLGAYVHGFENEFPHRIQPLKVASLHAPRQPSGTPIECSIEFRDAEACREEAVCQAIENRDFIDNAVEDRDRAFPARPGLGCSTCELRKSCAVSV